MLKASFFTSALWTCLLCSFLFTAGCSSDTSPKAPAEFAPPPGPEDEKGDNEKG
ncbi:hypothetical protein SH449x_003806 [Pirellulaceae bacterium SH449]